MTFVAIVLIAMPVGLIIIVYMRPVSGHLALRQYDSPWRHLTGTVLVPRYLHGSADRKSERCIWKVHDLHQRA
jgi:hypothetical protein